jgi:cephalosporin hydroxylase
VTACLTIGRMIPPESNPKKRLGPQMNEYEDFKADCEQEISEMGMASNLRTKSIEWLIESSHYKYTYHFEWLGRPIIQYPTDIVALQEIIWNQKPDLIIETGIAHGGSLILNASILALLDLFDLEEGRPNPIPRKVIGIDIDIRRHNRTAIEQHPLSKRIELIEGSSVSVEVVKKVKESAKDYKRVMVILDSDHTHRHVFDELAAYSNFVSKDQYLVVFDTVIENFPEGSFPNRDWDKGNNPFTAVAQFLEQTSDFSLDTKIEDKLLVTVAPSGYLKRIS